MIVKQSNRLYRFVWYLGQGGVEAPVSASLQQLEAGSEAGSGSGRPMRKSDRWDKGWV